MPTRSPVSVALKRGDLTGGRLVKRAVSHWPGLSHAEWRALVTMCATALDDPDPKTGTEAGLYFGGYENLARSLGYDWPEGRDRESEVRRKGILRNIRRYVEKLATVKAIERADPDQKAYRGHALVFTIKVMDGEYLHPEGMSALPATGM